MNMRTLVSTALTLSMMAGAQRVLAQTESTALRLTLDEAVRLASEHNPDLAADRLDPQIGDTRVAQAASAFTPAVTSTLQRSSQLSPPTSFFVASGTQTDTYTSNVSVAQRLPWTGASYNLTWDSSRQASNSFLQTFNPTLRSAVQLGVSQPLLRDLPIDNARQQLMITRRNRDIADTRLRESTVHTLADVKRAYWNLVSANALVDVQQASLDLARELARVNQARVDVGQAPPLDLLAARAEVAQREEALIVAQAVARQAEDRLRTLILAPDRPDLWAVHLEPTDAPPGPVPLPDVSAAIATALRDRADLLRARKELENAGTSVQYFSNQRLPDVRLQASYLSTGLGGTRLARVGGFPGTLVGTDETTPFGRVLDQVFRRDFPTWTVGFTVSYPLGRSFEEAGLARARLEETQAKERLKALEVKAIRQVREAAWNLEMNAKRIEATRLAHELSEQRLDAEQKRFEVGMSTSFLVIQAQRDLAQVRNQELAATLAYDASLIDFDAVQQAAPAGGAASGSPGGSSAGGGVTQIPAPRVTAGAASGGVPTGVPPP